MTHKYNSRALRRLAEGIYDDLRDQLPDMQLDEFATSAVRQWITHDGKAVFFTPERQIDLVLKHTPLGKPNGCTRKESQVAWWAQLEEDWKVGPELLFDIIGQLNRGQSAETVNAEDVPLRLWVDPKNRTKGVEVLAEARPIPADWKTDHRKIAADLLARQKDLVVDEEEMDALVSSVSKQWQQYEGHACLFLDRDRQLVMTLTEKDGGKCNIAVTRKAVTLEPDLLELGFPPEQVVDVIARLNLVQEVEFQDRAGAASVLWYDPKERRIRVRRSDDCAKPKFDLGLIEIEPRAAAILKRYGLDAAYFLRRHAAGDWGDVSDRSKFENDYRLNTAECVSSCFHIEAGEKIVVSTLGDRKTTVISSPDPEMGARMVRIVQAGSGQIVCCPRCTRVVSGPHEAERSTCPHCGFVF